MENYELWTLWARQWTNERNETSNKKAADSQDENTCETRRQFTLNLFNYILYTYVCVK